MTIKHVLQFLLSITLCILMASCGGGGGETSSTGDTGGGDDGGSSGETVMVQFLHNAPGRSIDIRINDVSVKTLAFREATAFLSIDKVAAISLYDSTTNEALYEGASVTFPTTSSYIYMIYGSEIPLSLKIKTASSANLSAGNMLFFHGAEDIGAVNIDFMFSDTTPTKVIQNLNYGSTVGFTTFSTPAMAAGSDIYVKQYPDGSSVERLVNTGIDLSTGSAIAFLTKQESDDGKALLMVAREDGSVTPWLKYNPIHLSFGDSGNGIIDIQAQIDSPYTVAGYEIDLDGVTLSGITTDSSALASGFDNHSDLNTVLGVYPSQTPITSNTEAQTLIKTSYSATTGSQVCFGSTIRFSDISGQAIGHTIEEACTDLD